MTGQNLDTHAGFTFMTALAGTINCIDEALPGQDFKEEFLKMLDTYLEGGILNDQENIGLDTGTTVMLLRRELERRIGLAKVVSAMRKDP